MAVKKKPIQFEEALNELENIVQELEQGNLTLNQSLEVFQRGIELSRICNEQLTTAEKRIDLLVQENDGNISIKSAKIVEENHD